MVDWMGLLGMVVVDIVAHRMNKSKSHDDRT